MKSIVATKEKYFLQRATLESIEPDLDVYVLRIALRGNYVLARGGREDLYYGEKTGMETMWWQGKSGTSILLRPARLGNYARGKWRR